MRNKIISIVGVAALSVSLMSCTASSSDSVGDANGLERLQEAGSVRAAFITARPLAYIDEETGLLDGSGVTVLRTIMANLGVDNVDGVLTDFDAIIPGLTANRWDISAFPFYVTPARCENVAFTNPTAQYLEGAMVATGNPLGISSYEDFSNPNIRIAIGSGNAEIDWAKDNGAQDSQISLFTDEALALEALRNGQVDVYLNAQFSMNQALMNYDPTGLEIASPFTGPIIDGVEVVAYGAWALRSDDTELREAFNAELLRMIESGELLELQQPFGYDAESIPDPSVTSASLCPAASWAK